MIAISGTTLNNSFCAQHTRDPRVTVDSLAQGARRGFESALENVVRVSATQTVDMQIELRRFSQRSPEVFRQLNRKVSNLLASCHHFIDQVETA
jgi:hypothetical protein